MTSLRRTHRPATLAALALAAGALLLALAAPAAHAARRLARPRIVFIRCSSDPYPCQGSHRIVVRTGRMLIGAGGMRRGVRVEFPARTRAGRRITRRVRVAFRTPTRIVVRIPGDAISGAIRVVNPDGRASNRVRITVRKAPRRQPATRTVTGAPQAGASPFDGSGMWIWYLRRAEGGDVARIAARARAAGVRTIFVKSADGTNVWSQFSAGTVAALKATGLRVCGWQFVYGNDPLGEARAGAAAKDAGADCFVIDAEGAYEGKYAQAQRYVNALRDRVGDDFPVGLTSFPYVHYHGAFPYSVFMGPRGATFNLPQVYWKTIGDSVDESLAITYTYNRVYKVPIYPLGQAYDGTKAADLRRFRQLSAAYGARGVSWWVWDYASASDWAAIGADIEPLAMTPAVDYPDLRAGANGGVGSRGDLVVWAQQHLNGAGHSVAIDGAYGPGTARAVRAFQAARGLPQTGAVDDATWPVLLREQPAPVNWVARARASARASAAAAAAGRRAALPARNGPASARMPAVRYEVPPGRG